MKGMSVALRLFVGMALAVMIDGCGGGGGGNSGQAPRATSGSVSGTLVNSVTKSSLPGITVSVSGTAIVSVTDSNGAFNLQSVPFGPQTLVFTDSAGDSTGTDSIQVSSAQVSLGAIDVLGAGNPPPVPVYRVRAAQTNN
jgi:hypothetical protein